MDEPLTSWRAVGISPLRMKHLMVVLWALAFGAGLTAITVVYQALRRQRTDFLRHYLHYLLLANLTVGGTLVMVYVGVNLAGPWPLEGWRRVAAPAFLVTSFFLVAAFVYKLMAVMLGLLGRDFSARVRLAYVSVVGAAPFAVLATLWLQGRDPTDAHVMEWSETLNLSLVAAAMLVTLHALSGSRALIHRGYRRGVQIFCALHLALYLLIPLASLLTYPHAFHALFLSFAAMNLVPLVLLRRLLEHRGASELAEPGGADVVEAFSERYAISVREREIVRLLLAGGTNSEIAAALYISSNTVKNHVYNVYRKAGVRSRIELANLVLGASSDGDETAPDKT